MQVEPGADVRENAVHVYGPVLSRFVSFEEGGGFSFAGCSALG